MSDLLQSEKHVPGQHPDADQLSAFVEHILPEHERLEMLAHLAACSNCREVVALSLPTLEDAAVAEPTLTPKPGFGSRFANWKLIWIAVPALAALVVLAIYLRHSPDGRSAVVPQTQIADAPSPAPQPLPPQPESTAVPASRSAPSRRAARAAEHNATTEATNVSPATPSATAGLVARDAASDGGMTVLKTPPASDRYTSGQSISGKSVGGPILAQRSAPSREVGAPSAAKPSGLSPVIPPSSLASAAPAPPPGNTVDSAAVIVTAQNSVVPAVSTNAAGFMSSRNADTMTQAPLPSGLEILSVASNFNRRLALDSSNQLFFSDDDGRHWKAISVPWHARAITVISAAAVAAVPGHAKPLALAVPERYTPGAMASAQPEYDLGSGGRLSGSVTDAAGAVIPGATVVATDNRTKLIRTVQTDAAGRYLVEGLPPGVYRIEVTLPGFMKQSATAVLAPSQQAVADIILAVGQSSETVTVETSAGRLNTFSRSMSLGAAKAKKSVAPLSGTRPPPGFVVTTDDGEHWTSADGESWKRE